MQPGNILLSLDGKRALLSDFGLVSEVNSSFRHSQLNSPNRSTSFKTKGVGTPPYAAPEQENSNYYDSKVNNKLVN